MAGENIDNQGGLTPRPAVRQDTDTTVGIPPRAADGEPLETAPAPVTPGVETGTDVPVQNVGGLDQPAMNYGAPGMRGMNDPAALVQGPGQAGPRDGLADAEHLHNELG